MKRTLWIAAIALAPRPRLGVERAGSRRGSQDHPHLQSAGRGGRTRAACGHLYVQDGGLPRPPHRADLQRRRDEDHRDGHDDCRLPAHTDRRHGAHVPRGALRVLRKPSAPGSIPGTTAGEEFVYPKGRAIQLAKASNVVVPALAVDVADDDALTTAPIVAITPDAQEVPSRPQSRRPQAAGANAEAVPSDSPSAIGITGIQQTAQHEPPDRQLPNSVHRRCLGLILFGGLGSSPPHSVSWCGATRARCPAA